ncbi:hypothetical protein K431DRAFT_300761 [Polychaeton citri CBS 116435]|uniref:Borealin N-terminal domain-containing protein n=1 Tax=Polychaeton citri CBS 116435 TaxID=1314669 RepID=A0A9P4QF06_9PEZI|nr:hypothetical protein K431DRAFT_300761 [Polychaeton citri CBS 116435]
MAAMATPQHSPSRRVAAITQAQKQALMDNIQLEITERARKLRAQHALQAQGLRTRLELRINRIPQALRKRTMQDLLDEHTQRANPKPPAPLSTSQTTKPAKQASALTRSKRKSDQISTDENQRPDAELQQDLPNPKKRTKAATANSKATRTGSRQQQQAAQTTGGGVLSPRSANSRTLPRSPLKSVDAPSQEKQATTSTTSRLAQPKSTTAARQPTSRQNSRSQKATTATKGKKGVEVEKENQSSEDANSVRESEASNTSAGTTVIKRGAGAGTNKAAASTMATATATATAAAKRAATAMAKRAPAVKAAPAARPATAAGGRILRKRG